jgi:hypothetical protein
MAFKPGQSGNPLGRAKKPIDPRSEIMQEICHENRDKLKLIGESIIDSAVKGEVWAIKESAKLFFPTPGTFVSVSKDEKTEIKILAANFVQSLTEDERRTFMQLYLKAEKSFNPMAMMESQSR